VRLRLSVEHGDPESAEERELAAFGSPDTGPLVLPESGGCWPAKNWPVENYVALGRRMIASGAHASFSLGTGNVRGRGAAIAVSLMETCSISWGAPPLPGRFASFQRLSLMVSDDSGLMHLAWTSGVPTVAMFGASRSTWSRPCGDHTFLLRQRGSTLRNLHEPGCSRGDLLCLRRVHPDIVFERCAGLLRKPGA